MNLSQTNLLLQYLDDLREQKILKDMTYNAEDKLFSCIEKISEKLTAKEYNGLVNEVFDCIKTIKHQYMQFGATGNEICETYNENWTPEYLMEKEN